MSSFVRRIQRANARRTGLRPVKLLGSFGLKLGIPPNDTVKKPSACRGTRRGKHREGFQVRKEA